MTFTKIVTHTGQFHADEILSIALLRVMGCVAPVERTYTPSLEDIANPRVCVLDVGKAYEPGRSNFDHHQDGQLESTNVLLLRHMTGKSQLLTVEVATILAERLFSRVSDVDRGKIIVDNNSIMEFNSIIRTFNGLVEGFERAIYMAVEMLTALIETAKKAIADEARWEALEKGEGLAIQLDSDPILCWKQKAKQQFVFLLVCPNLRGGWSIISRDTGELIIPIHYSQTFRHASGFMATYQEMQAAMDHARYIIELMDR